MAKIMKCKKCKGEAMPVPKTSPLYGWCKICWKLKQPGWKHYGGK